MKRTICLLMTVLMLLSLTVTVLADGTTTLTTTVPAATYTLNIPADQEVEFGALFVNIEAPKISESSGFANGKNVKLTVTYSPFASEGVATTIPFTISSVDQNGTAHEWRNGGTLIYEGKSNGTVSSSAVRDGIVSPINGLKIVISSDAWDKALGGDYTATITFTSEVVVDDT